MDYSAEQLSGILQAENTGVDPSLGIFVGMAPGSLHYEHIFLYLSHEKPIYMLPLLLESLQSWHLRALCSPRRKPTRLPLTCTNRCSWEIAVRHELSSELCDLRVGWRSEDGEVGEGRLTREVCILKAVSRYWTRN